MPSLLKRIWRNIVPVVGTDSRRVVVAIASHLPTIAGDILLSQLSYVVASPENLDRGNKYTIQPSATPLKGIYGLIELGVVEVCYYQQLMPFVVTVNNGYLYTIETKIPKPLKDPCKEYAILNVFINPEVLTILSREYH